MESQPQNPKSRNNPEKLSPMVIKLIWVFGNLLMVCNKVFMMLIHKKLNITINNDQASLFVSLYLFLIKLNIK